MKILEIFDSRNKKRRLSHIKNLVALACSDGSFDQIEMDLIFKIGVNSGISPEELRRVFQRPGSVSFYPPESYKDRIEQLYDMVLVMMVDGEFHANEIALCKLTALRLGFQQNIIDHIVASTIEKIENGIASELAIEQLLNKIT